jgi:hypothetical protein
LAGRANIALHSSGIEAPSSGALSLALTASASIGFGSGVGHQRLDHEDSTVAEDGGVRIAFGDWFCVTGGTPVFEEAPDAAAFDCRPFGGSG